MDLKSDRQRNTAGGGGGGIVSHTPLTALNRPSPSIETVDPRDVLPNKNPGSGASDHWF